MVRSITRWLPGFEAPLQAMYSAWISTGITEAERPEHFFLSSFFLSRRPNHPGFPRQSKRKIDLWGAVAGLDTVWIHSGSRFFSLEKNLCISSWGFIQSLSGIRIAEGNHFVPEGKICNNITATIIIRVS